MDGDNIVVYGKQNEELDKISTEYEDSFSLETFEALIKMHIQAGKSFLLARVTTWDSKHPGKEYYSYYNAYHLNKILFQTQMFGTKKLIHRLNVLNPLTNTDIVGDVLYFMVEYEKSDTIPIIIDTPFSPDKNRTVEILRRTSAIMQASLPPALTKRPSIRPDGLPSALSDPEPNSAKESNLFPVSPTMRYSKDDIFVKTALVSNPNGPRKSLPSQFDKNDKKNLRKLSKITEKSENESSGGGVRNGEILMVDIPKNGVATRFNQPIDKDKESSPIRTHRRELSAKNAGILQTRKISLDAIGEETVTKEKDKYFAKFIGTDTDYLETSKLRAVFRNNALNPEDVYLFEMPEFQPTNPSGVAQMEIIDAWYSGTQESGCLVELCALKPPGFNTMNRPRKFFHLIKCYILAGLVLGSMLFLILWTLLGVNPYSPPKVQ